MEPFQDKEKKKEKKKLFDFLYTSLLTSKPAWDLLLKGNIYSRLTGFDALFIARVVLYKFSIIL